MNSGWSAARRGRRHVIGRLVSAVAVSGLMVVTLVNSGASADARLSTLLRSPVSDGVKAAVAHRAGVDLRTGAVLRAGSGATVPTSPQLVVLPNVQASAGMANEVPITADPVTQTHLMTGANDYTCASLQGFDNSGNSGATWSHHCMPVVGAGGCGDPNVAYDRNGIGYVLGIGNCNGFSGSVAIQSTPDNGVTWGAAHTAFGSLLGGLTDKNWTEIDQSAASPFVNCLYTSWTDFDSGFTKTRASVAHSCDGGTTWTRVGVDPVTQTVPKIDQFTDLAIGPDGTVYVTWIQCQVNGGAGDCGDTDVLLRFSKSTDGGNTWSAPVNMATAHNSPDTCGGYYGCFVGSSERLSNIPVIDIDDTTGRLDVVYYTYAAGKTRVKYINSANGGTTWSAPIEPITKAGNQGWPWLSTNGSNIGVSFDHSVNNGTFIFVAGFSTNGGVSFTQKAKLSTASSKFSNDGNGGGFIGDYTGNIWTGNTLHASWADARVSPAVDMTGGATI
jgi:hypothetical protein